MRLVLDLETTSVVDLRRTGVHVYAEHPETRVTVLCYAVGQNAVETWLPGQPPAAHFVDAVRAGATVVAHNYLFEHTVYHKLLVPGGWPLVPLGQWSCTMARALVAGYPAGLELAGQAAGLRITKDHSARDLMLRFARPRNWSPLTWWHETDPERFKRLCDYCVRDVEAERELDKAIPELSDRERALFELDFLINQRGLGIDRRLVHDLADLADRAHVHLTGQIADLTGGAVRTLNQVAQLRAWLRSEGVDAPDLRRATVQALLADPAISGAPRTALEARRDASRSSTAKLSAIVEAGSNDGRVRGAFQFYGAARTGRWAGRRVQPQNLFRGSIKDVPAALKLIRAGTSPEDLELMFEDSPLGVIASCVRSTITAAPGYQLAIADFSQIEARVLAWLAGQNDVLDVFARDEDIYTHTAAKIGSTSRQLGKVTVLACGYGMGGTKFQATALGYGVVLDETEAAEVVATWRRANPRIVKFWYDAHDALKRVVKAGPGAVERVGHVTFICRRKALLAKLPSGRHLVYRHPKVGMVEGREEFSFMAALGTSWTRLRSWPGRTVENLTQAIARDVMADAMLKLGDVDLIATIHDELVAEVPAAEANTTLDHMLDTMRQTPVWAPGLPMNAAGHVAGRYSKG